MSIANRSVNDRSSAPRYSIIMAAYNQADFVHEALDSLFAQTFKDFEVIVCDDGSTDETPRVIREYSDRVTLLTSDHRGPAGARNFAIAVAKGEFISCMDSDNVWMPWTLECIDEAVQQYGPECLVYLIRTPMEFTQMIKIERVKTRMEVYPDFFSAPEYASHGAALIGAIPRQRFIAAGQFFEGLITDEDLDLVLRLGNLSPYVMIMEPITMLNRSHFSNLSQDRSLLYQSSMRIVERELKDHVYPGGRSYIKKRRWRLARLMSARCIRFSNKAQFRLGLSLYMKSFRLFCTGSYIGFLWTFPLYVMMQLIMARYGLRHATQTMPPD